MVLAGTSTQMRILITKGAAKSCYREENQDNFQARGKPIHIKNTVNNTSAPLSMIKKATYSPWQQYQRLRRRREAAFARLAIGWLCPRMLAGAGTVAAATNIFIIGITGHV